MVKRALVTVVDDDESMRESLPDLLLEFGYAARAFRQRKNSLCLIARPNQMPYPRRRHAGHGPDRLQQELKARRKKIPIIFITANRDETLREKCSNRAPRSACSNLSVIALCFRRSSLH